MGQITNYLVVNVILVLTLDVHEVLLQGITSSMYPTIATNRLTITAEIEISPEIEISNRTYDCTAVLASLSTNVTFGGGRTGIFVAFPN